MQRPDALPEARWKQARTRCAPRKTGKEISLINAMHVKLDLGDHLPLNGAFETYRALMHLDAAHQLHPRPLRELRAALEAGSEPPLVLNPGGETRVNRAPEVYGPGDAPELTNIGRRVLAGWIEDVTVFARSSMIARDAALYLDFQGPELAGFRQELAFDPVVFRRTGPQEVAFIDDTNPDRCLHLPQALSLLGINTVSFGHWILENLPQFLTARDILGRPLLGEKSLPVLVDADMPVQHIQSLRFFGHGGGPQIVKVPRGTRVQVDRLFAVVNWAYAPHLITTDKDLDSVMLRDVAEGRAGVYAKASAFARKRLAGAGVPVPARVQSSRRLFWARRPSRHRAIANWEALRDRLEALGYATVFPEELPFQQQVAVMQAADRIVVQNGSGSLGLFLTRPGTRVLYLSHPDMSRFAFQAEGFRCAGLEIRVLSGPYTRQAERWVDQSDYEIDMDVAETALAWMEEGMAPAPVFPASCLPDFAAPLPATDTPLPSPLAKRVAQLAGSLRCEDARDPWTDLQLKSALAEACPPQEAQARYIRALEAEGRMEMRSLPVAGLLARLQAEGRDVEIRDAPEHPVTARVARVVGPGTALDLTRVPRVVAGGWLDDAQVFSRSGTILQRETLLIDQQGDEAARVPHALGSDTVLFGSGEAQDTAVFIDEHRPDRVFAFDRAWSLMSQNSTAFGHWSHENLPRFLSWFARADLAGVPILIDANMPPQHRQSLDFMIRGRCPVVVIPPGGRVFVSRLFACTEWAYMPHLITVDPQSCPEQAVDFNVFASHTGPFAAQIAKFGAEVDRRFPPRAAADAERLYIVRDEDRYRKLANNAEISALLAARGYTTMRPEALRFPEQIRRLRAAREIVCQAGSAAHLGMYARAGTRMALLYHPAIRTVATVASLIQAAGVEFTMVTGPFEGTPAKSGFVDRSDYIVPPERLLSVIDGWSLAEPETGRRA